MKQPNATFRNAFKRIRDNGTLTTGKYIDEWKFHHVTAQLMDNGYTKAINVPGVLYVIETYDNTYLFRKGNQETLENLGV